MEQWALERLALQLFAREDHEATVEAKRILDGYSTGDGAIKILKKIAAARRALGVVKCPSSSLRQARLPGH